MNCCKDCRERNVGCHATCQKYIADKAQRDADWKRIRREREIDNYLYSMQHKRRKINEAIRKRGNE